MTGAQMSGNLDLINLYLLKFCLECGLKRVKPFEEKKLVCEKLSIKFTWTEES